MAYSRYSSVCVCVCPSIYKEHNLLMKVILKFLKLLSNEKTNHPSHRMIKLMTTAGPLRGTLEPDPFHSLDRLISSPPCKSLRVQKGINHLPFKWLFRAMKFMCSHWTGVHASSVQEEALRSHRAGLRSIFLEYQSFKKS